MRTSKNKKITLILLVVSLLPNTGCVYIRLLKTKRQCAQFDRYFDVDDQKGLTISLRKPVLYDKDMRWLGLEATSKETQQDEQTWKLVFEKLYHSRKNDDDNFDMTVSFRFKAKMLQAIHFPENYLLVLPKQVFIAMFKSFGDATIDKRNRTFSARIGDTEMDFGVPYKVDVMKLLGKPYAAKIQFDTEALTYKYQLKTARVDGGKAKGKLYWIELEVDKKT